MKAEELRGKDEAALKQEVVQEQRAYFGLRMQKATQQLNNTASLKVARRSIARAKTILTQKQNSTTAK